MKIQLSISMLISDRKNTVERSLESIVPLLRELQSELIVVWTGQDESVLDIVKRYTDKIIPFTWCNDFSKARNTGYDAAQGEWFLYLDDDEWFDDVRPMIDFFQTGEEVYYNFAVYLQRNYSDWGGERYTDAWVGRMCRRLPEVRFVHPIHEVLSPCLGPRKRFPVFVHHYGYIRKKTEASYTEKGKRNLPLLIEAIRREPHNFHHYSQILKEYISGQEYDKAEEIARKALELMETLPDSNERTYIQTSLVECLDRAGKKEKAEQEALDILAGGKTTRTAQMLLYRYLLNHHSDKPDSIAVQGLELLRKFDSVCDSLTEEPDGDVELVTGVNNDGYMKEHRPVLYMYGAGLALSEMDKEETIYWLSKLPWGTAGMLRQYYNGLETWREKVPCPELVAECIAQIDKEDAYIYLQKVIYSIYKEKEEEALSAFRRCCELAEPWLFPLITKLGISQGWNCSAIVRQLSLEQWNDLCQECLRREDRENWSQLEQKAQEAAVECPAYAAVFHLRRLEEELIQGQLWGDEFHKAFINYCRDTSAFYRDIYSENLMKQITDGGEPPQYMMVDPECRFALVFANVLESGDLEAWLNVCRRSLKVYPRMAGVIRQLLDYFDWRFNRMSASPGEEFQQLALQVKGQVQILAQSGQTDAALQTLNQLLKLIPGDMEAIRMKQKLLEEQD